MSTFYRRDLPLKLIKFNSSKGKQLFKNALKQGNAEIYFSLAGNFVNQSEPAFCGLGSLVMVLNALEVDPNKRWKGVWRWYADELLECKPPLGKIREKGLNLQELADLGRCNGLAIKNKRVDQTSFVEFQRNVLESVRSNDKYIITNFSRKELGQTGDGHFSPIGAYDDVEGKVLVLDTARFKYPSYFVGIRELYQAMNSIDADSRLKRGYLLLTRGDLKPLSLVKIKDVFRYRNLSKDVSLIKNEKELIRTVLFKYLDNIKFLDSGVDLAGDGLDKEYINDFILLRQQVCKHPLYRQVQDVISDIDLPKESGFIKEKQELLATIFILSIPTRIFVDSNLLDWFTCMSKIEESSTLLLEETTRISQQIITILNKHCTCNKNNNEQREL
jgi:glutathione gamma-glutamylcysteinyltransferase